jgi:hypothetical protein
MKLLTTLMQKFMPKKLPLPVGRWKIESCDTKTNNKIDLSNEDHCGPCGQYALTKTTYENKDNHNKIQVDSLNKPKNDNII